MPARASAAMLGVGVGTIVLAIALVALSFIFAAENVAPVAVMVLSLYIACIGALGIYAALNTAQIASCSAILLFFASIAALLAIAVAVGHEVMLHSSLESFVEVNLDTITSMVPSRLYDGAAAAGSSSSSQAVVLPWWTSRSQPGDG